MIFRSRCSRCGYTQSTAVPAPGATVEVVRCVRPCTALGAVWRTRSGELRWDGYHSPAE